MSTDQGAEHASVTFWPPELIPLTLLGGITSASLLGRVLPPPHPLHPSSAIQSSGFMQLPHPHL